MEKEEFLILRADLQCQPLAVTGYVQARTHLSNTTVITLGRLLEELLVFNHLLRVGEGDAVHALQTGVVGVPKEVRRRVLQTRTGCEIVLLWVPGGRRNAFRTLSTAIDLTRPV